MQIVVNSPKSPSAPSKSLPKPKSRTVLFPNGFVSGPVTPSGTNTFCLRDVVRFRREVWTRAWERRGETIDTIVRRDRKRASSGRWFLDSHERNASHLERHYIMQKLRNTNFSQIQRQATTLAQDPSRNLNFLTRQKSHSNPRRSSFDDGFLSFFRSIIPSNLWRTPSSLTKKQNKNNRSAYWCYLSMQNSAALETNSRNLNYTSRGHGKMKEKWQAWFSYLGFLEERWVSWDGTWLMLIYSWNGNINLHDLLCSISTLV